MIIFGAKQQLTCPAVSTSWRLKSWPFTLTILLKAGKINKWASVKIVTLNPLIVFKEHATTEQ